MTLLKRRIQDREVLRLIGLWLKVGVLGTAAAEEEARWGISIPFETLFGLTKAYMERAVDWGIEQLLERPTYPFVGEELEYEPLGEEAAREEALRRLSKDLLLLLLSFSKPILKRARKLPSLGARVRRAATPRNVALGVAMALLGALIPLARKALIKEMGPVGTPQGSPISPLLANVYLHEFDVAMTRRGHKLVRYADDFVLLCRDEAEAGRALADAEKALADLRLKLNPTKTRIVPFDEGFSFLGTAFTGEGLVEGRGEGPLMGRMRALARSGYEMAKQGAARVGERSKVAFQRGKSVATRMAEVSGQRGRSFLERGRRGLRRGEREGGE
ncbi:MAG TPA: hypothetical protein EYP55_00320 [Anaerolineae bacterium]|nr:hypothetical protein [Anaerolineae bacterium]